MTDLKAPYAPACDEMRLLIQADQDGELDAAASAVLAAHIADCPGCAGLQRDLAGLSRALRAELRPEPAPDALRRAVALRLSQAAGPPPRRMRPRMIGFPSFVAGAAIAASLVLLLPARAPDTAGELIAGHIRALQPGHLTDVLSSDQHTVKPWFDGRIDYAPPVLDFAAQGFPLMGGRLDYIGARPVAALVYHHDKHPIDVFVWPGTGTTAPSVTDRLGYNIVSWTQGGMTFRAVSDLNAAELLGFAKLWPAAF